MSGKFRVFLPLTNLNKYFLSFISGGKYNKASFINETFETLAVLIFGVQWKLRVGQSNTSALALCNGVFGGGSCPKNDKDCVDKIELAKDVSIRNFIYTRKINSTTVGPFGHSQTFWPAVFVLFFKFCVMIFLLFYCTFF